KGHGSIQDGLKLRLAVLELQVDMSRGRPCNIGDLARDPDRRIGFLKQALDVARDFANGEHLDAIRNGRTAHFGTSSRFPPLNSTIGAPCSSCRRSSTSAGHDSGHCCHSDSSRIQYESSLYETKSEKSESRRIGRP